MYPRLAFFKLWSHEIDLDGHDPTLKEKQIEAIEASHILKVSVALFSFGSSGV